MQQLGLYLKTFALVPCFNLLMPQGYKDKNSKFFINFSVTPYCLFAKFLGLQFQGNSKAAAHVAVRPSSLIIIINGCKGHL